MTPLAPPLTPPGDIIKSRQQTINTQKTPAAAPVFKRSK
jgi:hypothetical protein